MPSVGERLQRRRFYPVRIAGETVHVRALLDSERRAMLGFLNEPESFGYVLGCCLLNDDQSRAFTAHDGEGPQAFGARVLAELDLPDDTKGELCRKVLELSKGPPEGEFAKN